MANGLLKLDSEKLEASIGTLQKSFNEEVLEAVGELASVIKGMDDDNKILEETKVACKTFQEQYNVALEGVDAFVEETAKVYDIAEYMAKRATVGEVGKRDTGFAQKKMNADKVMI